MSKERKLTQAQKSILENAREDGLIRLGGVNIHSLIILRSAGLVEYEQFGGSEVAHAKSLLYARDAKLILSDDLARWPQVLDILKEAKSEIDWAERLVWRITDAGRAAVAK